MLPALLIAAKRDRRELSDKEIAFLVQGFAAETSCVRVAG